MSEVANITLVNGHELFLIKRGDSKGLDHPELWASPGGSIDLGESPQTAALREFSEELGVDLRTLGISEENLMNIPSRPDGGNIVYSFALQITDAQK